MDKLEFTDWSEVQRRLGSREIAIFRQGGLKVPPVHEREEDRENEANKEEGLGLHNPEPKTGTNISSFAKKIIKIYSTL